MGSFTMYHSDAVMQLDDLLGDVAMGVGVLATAAWGSAGHAGGQTCHSEGPSRLQLETNRTHGAQTNAKSCNRTSPCIWAG